jgi:hypothetical protein
MKKDPVHRSCKANLLNNQKLALFLQIEINIGILIRGQRKTLQGSR